MWVRYQTACSVDESSYRPLRNDSSLLPGGKFVFPFWVSGKKEREKVVQERASFSCFPVLRAQGNLQWPVGPHGFRAGEQSIRETELNLEQGCLEQGTQQQSSWTGEILQGRKAPLACTCLSF